MHTAQDLQTENISNNNMKHLLLFLTSSLLCFGGDIVYKDGRVIKAQIMEANATHVLLKKESDLQLFRVPISFFTLETQNLVELYHATNRHGGLKKLPTPVNEKSVAIFASHIDSLVNAKLKTLKVSKTQKTDDYEFARRIYLTVLGRIPTQNELTKYTESRDPNKKPKLIKELLDHPGYINNELNWLSDLLRIKDRLDGTNINLGIAYRQWIRRSLESNQPYDEMVRDLIASNGELYGGNDSAAISFYLRDRGMQPDHLSHTIRIFLGTRLQCAMCHNHPFDKWTQKQFYEMTAFTSGIGAVRIDEQSKKIGKLSKAIQTDADPKSGLFNNWRNQVRDSLQFGIENNGTGKIKLPKDFAESDGNPGDLVYAKSIFTPNISLPKDNDNSRIIFANWITSEDNPRFATVISNRLWKRIFGIALIEPIDTMTDETIASNPELLKFIEKLIISLDFDTKEFKKILLSTDLFSRKSFKEDFPSIENFHFAGPPLRRMTGEQIWDSLVTLVYNNIDSKERLYIQNNQDYSIIYNRYKDLNSTAIYNDFKSLVKMHPENRNLLQILSEEKNDNKKFKDKSLIRSSYLPYPAPGGHLIRQFGGSDKEQIENSNFEPNTTQVLNLLNGFVEKNILNNKNADFIKFIEEEKTINDQIVSAFLSILGREPNPKELKELKPIIDKKNGFKHVSWILLNTHEFIFIQ